MRKTPILALVLATAAACASCAARSSSTPFAIAELAQFHEPWALAILPDGRVLVTEKGGKLKLWSKEAEIGEVSGVPKVAYGGQGGLGDVVLHPRYAANRLVYLSYAEAGNGGARGAVVARAKLALDDAGGGRLEDLRIVWRQDPKVAGEGHYGHRIAFGDGKLWISSGDRQHFDPAQDKKQNLGKILRLNDDGSIPDDNPFASEGGVAAQIWTLGHRNPLGIAFDADGQLWNTEMGPKGGDELNRVVRGSNYGYPTVSNGDHYSGEPIPDHDTRPEFAAPVITWTPVISPAGLVFYSGEEFADWKGDALIPGLSSQAIVRVEFDDDTHAHEAERYDMGQRIRAIAQVPDDGSLYVLEDTKGNDGGRLLHLTSAK